MHIEEVREIITSEKYQHSHHRRRPMRRAFFAVND